MPNRSKLPPGDAKFLLEQAMPSLGISRIRMTWSDSRKKWPDIWCDPSTNTITVTQEWRRQDTDERRKRLVHECLHLIGYEHGWYHGLEYSTYPKRDNFSMMIYRAIHNPNDDAISLRAKQIYDSTRPSLEMLRMYGREHLSPIQRATLSEIESHLRMIDRIGKELGKNLDPARYELGITEEEARKRAKVYWTKGRRIQKAKSTKEIKDYQRVLLYEAIEILPDNYFLKSLERQLYDKRYPLSKKQMDIVKKIIETGANPIDKRQVGSVR